jgi:hypothetical protein
MSSKNRSFLFFEEEPEGVSDPCSFILFRDSKKEFVPARIAVLTGTHFIYCGFG